MPSLSLPVAHKSIDASLLPEIVRLYLDTKRESGAISDETHAVYTVHLAPFLAWWERCEAVHHGQLSPELLRHARVWIDTEYVTAHGGKPMPNTIAHCWRVVRQLFNWAFRQNCTGTVNLAEWCPDVPLVRPSVHFPSVEELTRILAAPTGDTRLRDVALIAFLVSTGARRYEVSVATVEAIEWQTPVTNLALGADHRGYCLLRKQKGDREGKSVGRPVVFCSVAGLLLKAYLRSVSRVTGSIFGLSDSGIAQLIEKHATAAGCPQLSPHGFRRMLADYWDEIHGLNGRAALKRQLGHSLKGDVTEAHYLTRNTARIARDVLKWHVSPLESLRWDWTQYPVHIPDKS